MNPQPKQTISKTETTKEQVISLVRNRCIEVFGRLERTGYMTIGIVNDAIPDDWESKHSYSEQEQWVSVEIEPSTEKYYQLACNDDVYLDFFKWLVLDLSNNPTPCFMSVNDNTVMEKHEVTHYRELNVDPPDWTGLMPPKQ